MKRKRVGLKIMILPLCGMNFVFSGFFAGLRLVVIFMRWSKYNIENAKFCAESNGGGDFYQRPPHPF
jgi:hypothetical protein